MFALRALIRQRSMLAMLLLALTLGVKALVPGGYMPGSGARTFTVQLCAEGTEAHRTIAITIPSSGDTAPAENSQKADGHCVFCALSWASLCGADALLLAIALGFILTLGFRAVAAPPRARVSFLLPPLRGPPVAA